MIQRKSSNQLDGYDYEYYAYNFTNQVTQKQIEHNVAGQAVVREEYTYNYDHAGRLQTVLYSYGGRPVNIANYAYDEAGRMKQKKTGVGLETTNYLYNVRNWVTSQTGSRFSENLYYTNNPKSGGLSYFGGNISALTWNASPNMTVQGYSFQYDNLGQLKHAVYGANSMLGININRYNESFTYDKHGNIQTLQRYGLKDNNSFGLIDDLTMTHQGNLLTEVEDAVGDQSSSDLMEFKNRFYFGWGGEYGYNNGNMTWDYNKEICQIRYNYLSLPKSVQFRHGNRIEYVYDAAGMRRTTIHKEADMDLNFDWWSLDTLPNSHVLLQTKTDYIANKVYVNGQLSKILTEEGYVAKENGNLNAYYYLKDHLGNNRMVMNSAGTIVQTNNFYPSGTSMANYPRQTWQGVQPYKYNGKELDRSNGLDFYNYEARSFDPVLMRFTAVDPLAGKYYSISPFAYCLNNPVRYVDPDGRDIWEINQNGLLAWTKTDDQFDKFFLNTVNSKGEENSLSLGQFDKNENGLIQLPSEFSFSDETSGIEFGFTLKKGNESNSYIRGDAFASLMGALSTTNTNDLTIIGFSESDGSSPKPSVSHKNGVNGDLRYLRTDESGGAVLLNQQGFDINRQNIFNEALYKFGWKNMLSEKFTPAGGSTSTILNRTIHYNKSRHNNHLHLQGYTPNIIKK